MSVNKEWLWKEKVGEYRKENHCGLLVWGRASASSVAVLVPKNRDPGVSSKQDARDGLHGSLGNHPTFSHEARGLTLQYPC